MAAEGGAITLSEWSCESGEWKRIAVFASMVGQNGIEAGKWYTLRDGKPVEV
jgi:hypothetical protein